MSGSARKGRHSATQRSECKPKKGEQPIKTPIATDRAMRPGDKFPPRILLHPPLMELAMRRGSHARRICRPKCHKRQRLRKG